MWLFLAMLMVVLAHLGIIAAVIIAASLAGGAWLWLTRPSAQPQAVVEPATDEPEPEPVLTHRAIQVPRQHGERVPADDSPSTQRTH